jgi:hypothetical protein
MLGKISHRRQCQSASLIGWPYPGDDSCSKSENITHAFDFMVTLFDVALIDT